MSLIMSGSAEPSPSRPWPADRVEHWPLESLIPYVNNPRLHSDADVERIAASIVKWGWTHPALVASMTVHGDPQRGMRSFRRRRRKDKGRTH
jgi:hypothetical protein